MSFVVANLEMHSEVALLEDLPAEGSFRGQVGTVVENWAPAVYEVEFCDNNGRAFPRPSGPPNPALRPNRIDSFQYVAFQTIHRCLADLRFAPWRDGADEAGVG